MLERLFLTIRNDKNQNTSELLIIPEMINLLGCSQENFIKLIKEMNYKTFQQYKQFYFKYLPRRNKYVKENRTVNDKNPFNVLKKLEFKSYV